MPRVLILEDERLVARDLQKILGTMGYQTSMAASGEEAVEVALRDHPDLALVDIHLAGKLDGIETASALRQQANLAVVYLTAHADEQTLERAKATEPAGYLVKPFDEATLRTTLQMAIHRCGIERGVRIEQKLRTTVLDQLTVGLITTDCDGNLTMINARGQSLTGWSQLEAAGKSLSQVLTLRNADNISVTAGLLGAALDGREKRAPEGLLKLVSKSGIETCVDSRVSPVQGERQETVGVSLVFWPVGTSERESASPAASPSEPESDPVTGLPGRDQARAAFQWLQNRQPNHFAALFVLDRYDVIARRYGTKTADQVLVYYCTFLAQEVPLCKKLFRWTGPSFLAVYGPLDCLRMAQRVVSPCTHTRLEKEFQLAAVTVLLPVSGSVEVFSIDGKPLDALIGQIDSFVAIQTRTRQC
jgi:PAS domain S-box-containing protein